MTRSPTTRCSPRRMRSRCPRSDTSGWSTSDRWLRTGRSVRTSATPPSSRSSGVAPWPDWSSCPPTIPQYRRNRERVIRDAERENILLEWDLGVPEEEAVPGGRRGAGRGDDRRASVRGRTPHPELTASGSHPEPPRYDPEPFRAGQAHSAAGSSSSGRLIRSSHSPGASTSEGVGRLRVPRPTAGPVRLRRPVRRLRSRTSGPGRPGTGRGPGRTAPRPPPRPSPVRCDAGTRPRPVGSGTRPASARPGVATWSA